MSPYRLSHFVAPLYVAPSKTSSNATSHRRVLRNVFFSQKYHEDFGYYHLPYLIALVEHKLIFGLANTNWAFIHNSLWLNVLSIHFLPEKNFNFVTLSTFLLYVCFVVFSAFLDINSPVSSYSYKDLRNVTSNQCKKS